MSTYPNSSSSTTPPYVYENDKPLTAPNAPNDYSTLGHYYQGEGQIRPPLPSQTNVQKVIVVPAFGGTGYNVLQNNLPISEFNDSGYYTLRTAYPSFPSNCNACTRYVSQ